MKDLKRSVITHGIGEVNIDTMHNTTHLPRLGDVAVFEVVSLGKHTVIETVDENLVEIFPGDHILMAFGGRYSADGFEGYVPDEPQTELQILGQGGAVGMLISVHQRFRKTGATEVRLVGYAIDNNNQVINTCYYETKAVTFSRTEVKDYEVYLSVGSSTGSGKTTTATHFVKGAMQSGKRVAYIKLTGTVGDNDKRIVEHSGVAMAMDFSYCGYPSTYMCPTEDVLNIYATLLKHIENANPDIVVVEIADGLSQAETSDLLRYSGFVQSINGVILSCPDNIAVSDSIKILQSMDIKPMMICGGFTADSRMMTEVNKLTDIAIFSLDDFAKEGHLIETLQRHSEIDYDLFKQEKESKIQFSPAYISQYIQDKARLHILGEASPQLRYAALAMAALLVGQTAYIVSQPSDVTYQAASGDAPSTTITSSTEGTYLVIFSPTAKMTAISELLKETDAHFIGGPQSQATYRIGFASQPSAETLAKYENSKLVAFIGEAD